MTALNFGQLQALVIKDGFTEADRADVKNWIIARHAWLWDSDEWTFRMGTATVTFTANSQIVAGLPTDFRIATALYNQQGSPLTPERDIDKFFDDWNTLQNLGSSGPVAYTVVGTGLLVGPKGDGTTGLLVYEKSKPALITDLDSTGLPDGYDMTLVHGAKAEGFTLKNVPLAQTFENHFAAGITALQKNYLTGIRGQVGQMGAFRPGSFSQW